MTDIKEAPPLVGMSARKDKLEADRAEIFPKWKAALEAAGGNVSRAGRMIAETNDPAEMKSWTAFGFTNDMDPVEARSRANRLTRRLGLVAYAAELRLKAGTGARVTFGTLKGKVMGRPPGPNKRKAGSG